MVFTLDGDWEHEQKFCHEVVSDDDGSLIIRAAADGSHKLIDVDALEPVYTGRFPVEKIDGFIKNLQCGRMLEAKVKTGVPIMLQHKLAGAGDESQIIRFLLAPTIEDEA